LKGRQPHLKGASWSFCEKLQQIATDK